VKKLKTTMVFIGAVLGGAISFYAAPFESVGSYTALGVLIGAWIGSRVYDMSS